MEGSPAVHVCTKRCSSGYPCLACSAKFRVFASSNLRMNCQPNLCPPILLIIAFRQCLYLHRRGVSGRQISAASTSNVFVCGPVLHVCVYIYIYHNGRYVYVFIYIHVSRDGPNENWRPIQRPGMESRNLVSMCEMRCPTCF